MKLISCHIENFGRLHRLDCSFSDGLNMICRENGWGKSTFAAFLCAMFYGLPPARKKSPEENERNRYSPWQGGAYGGSLIFEAYGKRYEITRMFGRRESEDEFELRDLDTNIPCFDFSPAVGKELFCMDRDSFLRTVYTRQQDCVTAVTDDVNALIGNLTETAGDMGSYEDAMKRLREAANRLSPKRQTGRISRREEEIKRLERDASGWEETREQIRELSEQYQGALREAESLETELQGIENKMEEIRRNEENARQEAEKEFAEAGERQVRERLLRTLDQRRQKAAQAAARFSRRIPSGQEVEDCLKKCREMERLEDRMEDMMLSEEEQDRLTALEEFCEKKPDRRTASGEPGEEKPDRRTASGEPGEEKPDRRTASGEPGEEKLNRLTAAVSAAAGTVLLLSGITLLILAPHSPGGSPAFRVIGALMMSSGILSAFAAAGRFHAWSFFRKKTSSLDRGYSGKGGKTLIYDREPAGLDPGSSSPEESRQWEYRILREKEKKLEILHAKWAEARRPVAAFLSESGISPKEDLRAQLEFLRDAVDDYEDACSLVREAEEELRGFDEETAERTRRQNTGQNPGTFTGDDLYGENDLDRQNEQEQIDHPDHLNQIDPAEMRRRADRTHTELLKCREAAAEYSRVLEELRTEQEEREASRQKLSVLQEQQSADRTRYSHITRAAACLQKAREKMTARYADPIRGSFSGYWERITGFSAKGIRVDANTAVTLEEMGRQRDTALLSAGYRDFAGLCLRFALADAMYQGRQRECPPLILDDPFTNLDDKNTAGALRLLQEAAGKYQIIYFTCSSSRC